MTGVTKTGSIIDINIGGGSLLVDHLLEAGYEQLSVLDIAPAALHRPYSKSFCVLHAPRATDDKALMTKH